MPTHAMRLHEWGTLLRMTLWWERVERWDILVRLLCCHAEGSLRFEAASAA
jgi:hypothetical protein